MKTSVKSAIIALLFCYACTSPGPQGSIDDWKKEIVEAEQQFAEMAKNEGIPAAFLAFAADGAVLMRNNKVIESKEAIRSRFDNASPNNNSTLSWKPDFVDLASSGDLGYTYGEYVFTSIDSLGNKNEIKGIFHTVWRRQADGSWKFVWD